MMGFFGLPVKETLPLNSDGLLMFSNKAKRKKPLEAALSVNR